MNNKDKFDIVIGIPSYNESDSITHVAEVVGKGLEKYFPNKKCIIVNVDNDSPDNTKEAFLKAKTRIEKKYISTGKGVRGKGNNILNLLNFSRQVNAEAAATVDADLKSIRAKWVEYLIKPVYNGYDFITPYYSRHQFDGTLTNHICYPVMFGMLSLDIRQPIGGEFSFSPRMIDYWLKQQWLETVKHYGIDVFLTLNAVFGDFKICQSGLGTKVHKASAPKLGIMFEQVINTLFSILAENKEKWIHKGINDLVKPTIFGPTTVSEPQELKLNVRDMKDQCINAFRDNLGIIKELLDTYAYSRVSEMSDMDYYKMDILLWSQIFYRLIFQYNIVSDSEERKSIINAMKPLYLSRSLSFDYETWKYNIKYAENDIRNQALEFASQKHYLWGLYYRKNTNNSNKTI